MADKHEIELTLPESEDLGAVATEAKWESPVLPPDDFSDDEEIVDSDEDQDGRDGAKKGKSGLAIFALLGVVALGGAGLAYTQFGNGIAQKEPTPLSQGAEQKPLAEVLQKAEPELSAVIAPPTITAPVVTPMLAEASPTHNIEPAPTVPEVANATTDQVFPGLPKIDSPAIAAVQLPVAVAPTPSNTVPEPLNNPVARGDSMAAGDLSKIEVAKDAVTASAKKLASEVKPQGLAQMLATSENNSEHKVGVDVRAVKPVLADPATKDVALNTATIPPVDQPMPVLSAKPNKIEAVVAVKKPETPLLAVPHNTAASKHTKAVVVSKIQPSVKPKAIKHAAQHMAKIKHPAVPVHHATQIAQSYVIKSAIIGEAWVSSAQDDSNLQHLVVGDVLPGVGKIKSIESKEGSWSIVGTQKTLR